ncbi:MAG: KH domain-containing protein [Bacillota bacterium]
MKQLLEHIARSLVDEPGQVDVRQVEGERSIILELRVAPGDMGKVIGKQGRIARAIRTVVNAAAVRDNQRVMVEIIQ